MGNIFAGSEVVELGIHIEKNGRDFYNTLVKQSKDTDARKVFSFLAAEEERHILVFQKILSGLDKYEPPEAYNEEYVAYMRSLAGEYVFTQENKGEKIAKSAKTDEEAIDLGMKFERDSIRFYKAMKKVVPDFDHKTVQELIIQEEKHLKQLTDLKNKL